MLSKSKIVNDFILLPGLAVQYFNSNNDGLLTTSGLFRKYPQTGHNLFAGTQDIGIVSVPDSVHLNKSYALYY